MLTSDNTKSTSLFAPCVFLLLCVSRCLCIICFVCFVSLDLSWSTSLATIRCNSPLPPPPQFLLAFVSAEDVTSADGWEEQLRECTSDDLEGNQCPGWYMVKQYMESRALAAASSPTAPRQNALPALAESWMQRYLGPVEHLLTRKYAAVGILEEFDTTLALFNATLDIPGLDWPRAFQEAGRQNTDGKYAREEAAAVLQGRADPDIQATLWLDILLYEHAVGVFNRQAKKYDLV